MFDGDPHPHLAELAAPDTVPVLPALFEGTLF
jgi:hypothetical protein